jgi:hypothetical protein
VPRICFRFKVYVTEYLTLYTTSNRECPVFCFSKYTTFNSLPLLGYKDYTNNRIILKTTIFLENSKQEPAAQVFMVFLASSSFVTVIRSPILSRMPSNAQRLGHPVLFLDCFYFIVWSAVNHLHTKMCRNSDSGLTASTIFCNLFWVMCPGTGFPSCAYRYNEYSGSFVLVFYASKYSESAV